MFERIMDEPRQKWVLEKHMHWTRRVGLLWPCLLLLVSAADVHAQEGPIQSGTAGVVALDDFSGSMSLTNDGGTYLLFHKMIGDGVGYDTGYSRLGLRAKIWEDYDRHIFGEIHTLITDSSRVGFNVGGGYRKLWDEGIWGVSAWYDNYESRSNYRYQQISFGSEYLHQVFDIRTNVYLPIGTDENFLSIVDYGNTPLFMDHTIGTMGIGQFERAYRGFDLEGGLPFPHLDWLRLYAGTYYLNADNNDVWGARGRVEARVATGVMLNFLASDDDTFGTNVNMEVEVRFDGRSPTRWDCNYCNLSRRYDQVRRNWSIQTHRDLDDIFIPLKNPRTGEDYNIVWVNNQAAAGGDGSFENPFTTLPAVADGSDLILVRRGVGNTTGRITLQPYQQILGEGKAHQINTDRLGLITLPAPFQQTGNMPTLTGDGTPNPVITLANHSVVRGFNINAQNAIAGTNLDSFLLECLRGNVTNGINIQNASGTGVIRDTEFDVAPGGTGILVTNTSGDPLNLTLGNIATRGGVFGTRIRAIGADIQYSILDLSASLSTSAGLSLEATNADLTGTATNVVTSGTPGTGVNIDLNNATGLSIFTNLQANNNAVDGLRALADDGSVYSLSILDSALNGNGDDNLDTDAVDGSTLNLVVDPTSMIFGV